MRGSASNEGGCEIARAEDQTGLDGVIGRGDDLRILIGQRSRQVGGGEQQALRQINRDVAEVGPGLPNEIGEAAIAAADLDERAMFRERAAEV